MASDKVMVFNMRHRFVSRAVSEKSWGAEVFNLSRRERLAGGV